MPWTLDGEREEGHSEVVVTPQHLAYRLMESVNKMKNTTLCYVTRGDRVLMLHRVKKKNDINHDKWIGIDDSCRRKARTNACSGKPGRRPA